MNPSKERAARKSRGFRWKDTSAAATVVAAEDEPASSRSWDQDRDRPLADRPRGDDDYRRRDAPQRRDARPGHDASPRRGALSGHDAPPRRDRRDGARDDKRGADARARSRSPVRAAPPPRLRVAAPAEEMIIVHVNDRLGTKTAVPCLPSDRISDFRILVAARIGREPHEILLKRQGERPFKDQLTLEDYGVSNGVQIDLEVDTGD